MSQQMDWTAYGGSAAEIYEHHMVPAIFGPWAEDLLALATPQPGERVLDVACGTGVVARLVAQRVGPSGTVVGFDLNPGMLTVARTLPPHRAHRSSGAKETSVRYLYQMQRLTSCSVNKGYSFSRTGQRP